MGVMCRDVEKGCWWRSFREDLTWMYEKCVRVEQDIYYGSDGHVQCGGAIISSVCAELFLTGNNDGQTTDELRRVEGWVSWEKSWRRWMTSNMLKQQVRNNRVWKGGEERRQHAGSEWLQKVLLGVYLAGGRDKDTITDLQWMWWRQTALRAECRE